MLTVLSFVFPPESEDPTPATPPPQLPARFTDAQRAEFIAAWDSTSVNVRQGLTLFVFDDFFPDEPAPEPEVLSVKEGYLLQWFKLLNETEQQDAIHILETMGVRP